MNVNELLKQNYINVILPRVCTSYIRKDRGEQKENYGSAATCDVACLQALSRRIHFGKFVAESKFRDETTKFVGLIQAEDRVGIRAAITNAEVEARVLERLRLKAKTYGTDPSADTGVNGEVKINVGAVVGMYKVCGDQISITSPYPLTALGNCYPNDQGCRSGIPDATAGGNTMAASKKPIRRHLMNFNICRTQI